MCYHGGIADYILQQRARITPEPKRIFRCLLVDDCGLGREIDVSDTDIPWTILASSAVENHPLVDRNVVSETCTYFVL